MVRDIVKSIPYRIFPYVVLDPLLESSLVIKLRHCLFFTKSYYCKALSGDSDYNICINSDMTVSCNCTDYDGSGHIGDVNSQTLEEVFHGKIAQSFRRKLARGWLPIKKCASCRELQRTEKRDARRHLENYRVPVQGIMVENTALCNFRCTSCPRDRIMKTRKRPSMSLADMEKVAGIIRHHGFHSVTFHNLGEPFSSKTIFEEVSIIKKYNPHVKLYISTNGFFLDSREKREAALLMDHIFFSIDGSSQELVSRYQIGADFERAYRNMKELVSIRDSRNARVPVVEWKYVVFKWNDAEDAIERAIELAKEARVDIISFWRGIERTSRSTGSNIVESGRFLHDPYFQRLGVTSWKGREMDLRDASGRKKGTEVTEST